MAQQTTDPVEALIDRIAEAVVRKIDERDKIDAIAQAVLARLEEQETEPAESSRTRSRQGAKSTTKASDKIKVKRPSPKKVNAR